MAYLQKENSTAKPQRQRMKLNKTASIFLLSTAISSHASEINPKVQELKSAATFTISSIAGAVAGGPVGFFLGALGGAYLGEQTKQNHENKDKLTQAQNKISQLENMNQQQSFQIGELEANRAKHFAFQIHFATGDDRLSEESVGNLRTLSDYILKNPDINVRLDGYADPRGTEEYNNVLARERAQSVARFLEEEGIDSARIQTFSHGATTIAPEHKTLDQFALERRVQVQIYTAKDLAAN